MKNKYVVKHSMAQWREGDWGQGTDSAVCTCEIQLGEFLSPPPPPPPTADPAPIIISVVAVVIVVLLGGFVWRRRRLARSPAPKAEMEAHGVRQPDGTTAVAVAKSGPGGANA